MHRQGRICRLPDHGNLAGLPGQGVGGGADDHGLGSKDTPTFSALILSSASNQLRIIDSDGGQEWRIGANSNLFLIEDENTGAIPFRIDDGSTAGLFTLTSDSKVRIGSADNSNNISIWHDNATAHIDWDDGVLELLSTESGLVTYVHIKGDGTSGGELKVFDQNNAEYIRFRSVDGYGFLEVAGTSPQALRIQKESNIPIQIFASAAEGQTQELQIYGFGTGSGGKESLDISVEQYAANTAEFFGLDAYMFNGNLITLNNVHSDADGARVTRHDFKGEQSGGEQTTLARIEISHDGAADDEKGKMVLSTNDGSDTDTPTDRVKIDADGAFQFESAGGLVFGCMYVASEFTVTIGNANPTEVAVTGTGDGWTAGDLKKVTFPTGGTEHYLTVPVAGIYEVTWSMSVHKDAGPATAIHGGIMGNGVAQTGNGEAHTDLPATDISDCITGVGTVDCPAGTEEISLWVSNDQSNDVHIDHGTMLIKQIGGT